MRRPLTVALLAAAAASAAFARTAALSEPATRPDLDHFKSRSIGITGVSLSTVTNILPPPEARGPSDVLAKIELRVHNQTDRALWIVVRLTPPAPSPPCDRGLAFLEANANVEFRCTQASLVADADYPLDITVFGDSALTDTLERNATRLRFDRGTVKWMDERLAFRRREVEADKGPKFDETRWLRENLAFGVVLAFSGGVVVPRGAFSDGFGTGGLGTTSFGLTGRRFGARLMFGSTEPGTRKPTDDRYSARLGRPVHVMQAIVPVELQGIASFPAQTGRFAVTLEAGAGPHVVTTRLKNSDDRLDEDTRFGFSAGGGVRCGVTAPRRATTVSAGLNGAFHGTGSSRYATVELELILFW